MLKFILHRSYYEFKSKYEIGHLMKILSSAPDRSNPWQTRESVSRRQWWLSLWWSDLHSQRCHCWLHHSGNFPNLWHLCLPGTTAKIKTRL